MVRNKYKIQLIHDYTNYLQAESLTEEQIARFREAFAVFVSLVAYSQCPYPLMLYNRIKMETVCRATRSNRQILVLLGH